MGEINTFTMDDIDDKMDKQFKGGKSFLFISKIYDGYTLGEDVWEYLAEKETSDQKERKKGSLLREDLVVDLFNRLPHSYVHLKKRIAQILFDGQYFENINHFEVFMEKLVNNVELSQLVMRKYLEGKKGSSVAANQTELELNI